MKLSLPELAAVLAGLRLLQIRSSLTMSAEGAKWLNRIFTSDGDFQELSDDAIDQLCEKLNFDEDDTTWMRQTACVLLLEVTREHDVNGEIIDNVLNHSSVREALGEALQAEISIRRIGEVIHGRTFVED